MEIRPIKRAIDSQKDTRPYFMQTQRTPYVTDGRKNEKV